MSDLEARIRRLEDIEAIRKLTAAYGRAADVVAGEGPRCAEFAALFADDAVWDVGMGSHKGPAAIENCMKGAVGQFKAVVHIVANPNIEVDGDRAKGEFVGLFPFVMADRAPAIWMSNYYHATFSRTAKGWRFQSLAITPTVVPPEFLPPAN